MTLKEYQEKAMTTKMKSSSNFSYMMLNLVGEVGEFASKVAKSIRKQEIYMDYGDPSYYNEVPDERAIQLDSELKKEAGDILWQLAGLCDVMGWDLEEIAQMNLDKLASRKNRKVIDGNGDNR